MDKFLLELYLPAAGVSYDVRVPANTAVSKVLPLIIKVVEDLSGSLFMADEGSLLCHRDTGIPLNINMTLAQQGLRNGDRIMLI